MGRFLLQFEDQRTPLRMEKDYVASFFFVMRRTAAIMGLVCVVIVLSSIVSGERQLLDAMIKMINRGADSIVSVVLPR